MNEEEYINVQQNLILLGQLIGTMDLDGFVAWINRAETIGPIADPTTYRQAQKRLGEVKRLAEAAQVFQREAQRQLGEVRR